jgi:uncharacterized RDD family membrane protein YckC
VSTPDRPSREELPGEGSGSESLGQGSRQPESSWLPPAGEQPETDPTGRPWERPAAEAPATQHAQAPSAWPGAGSPATPQAPAYANWPGADAPAQAPARPFTIAGYGSRAGAAAIDFLIRVAIAIVIVLIFGGAAAAAGGDFTVGLNIGSLLASVVGWVYATVMIAQYNGQTVGHKATSSRVVRADGGPLTAGQAFVREGLVKGILFDGLGILLLFIPTLLNYLWPLWDKDNEALHDKICSTRIVDA